MRDYARKIIRIDESDVTDPEMDEFLNEGYDRVVMHTDWPWLKAAGTEDIVMVSGQTQYPTTTPEAITTIVNKEQRYQLRSISKNQLDRYLGSTITTTQPTSYYWLDGLLSIFPSPSSTDTLEVHYVSVPLFGPLDTDEPVFNSLFHRIIVDWSLHRLWEMEEDFDKSTEYRARFEEGMARMTIWYNDLNMDTPNIFGVSPTFHHPSNMPFLSDAGIL